MNIEEYAVLVNAGLAEDPLVAMKKQHDDEWRRVNSMWATRPPRQPMWHDKYNMTQLKGLAKKWGLTGYSKMNKPQLAELLKAEQEKREAEGQ